MHHQNPNGLNVPFYRAVWEWIKEDVIELNTRDMLRRRNFHVQPNTHCVLCNDQVVEDINHLFFDCPFSTICWNKIGLAWDTSLNIRSRLEEASYSFNPPYFVEIFTIAAWEFWNIRNSKIFYGHSVNIQLWTVRFKAQVLLQLHRVREDVRSTIVQWLDTIL